MSFGNMNTFIEIIEKSDYVDYEGFSVNSHHVVAKVRAYREGRHASAGDDPLGGGLSPGRCAL